MKIKLFIFFFFYTLFVFSQNTNNGYIEYESGINPLKMDAYLQGKRKTLKSKNLTTDLDKIFLNSKKIKSTLYFSNYSGLFKVEDKLVIDKDNLAQKINRILAGDSKIYFFNDKANIYLIKDCETLGECFIFDNKSLEWKLTQEKREINGYVSYKATRNNNKVVAWYTPSIPLGFGPKGEYGLPGLILELEIGKIIFRATKIVLNPKEEIIIEEPKGGKRISYGEYSKILKKAKKSVFGN